MDFINFISALFHDWIGLMSGIGSVIFAFLGFLTKPKWFVKFFGKPEQRRKIFWTMAMAFFFIASVRIWTNEYQARKIAEENNAVKISGKILNVITSSLDKKGNEYVLFFVSILNNGANTTVTDYQAKASFDKHIINLQFEPIPDIYAGGLTVDNRQYFPLHGLSRNSLKKGERNDGVILFILKDRNKFKGISPKWILSFNDNLGKAYEMFCDDKETQIPFIFRRTPTTHKLNILYSSITGSTPR